MAFGRVWPASLLHNLSFIEFQVRYLALFLLFLVIGGFEWFWMGRLHKNIQLMLEFLKALGPTLFLLYIKDRPDDFICNIAIFADESALFSKCDQASDLIFKKMLLVDKKLVFLTFVNNLFFYPKMFLGDRTLISTIHLTLYFPMFLFEPPENIRKPWVF